jgi:hypothetical protein
MSTVQEDYIDSLDRLLDILRGQIDLARVVGVTRVAVEIGDLERLLNVLEGDAQPREQER